MNNALLLSFQTNPPSAIKESSSTIKRGGRNASALDPRWGHLVPFTRNGENHGISTGDLDGFAGPKTKAKEEAIANELSFHLTFGGHRGRPGNNQCRQEKDQRL